jgi:hypothetical protein
MKGLWKQQPKKETALSQVFEWQSKAVSSCEGGYSHVQEKKRSARAGQSSARRTSGTGAVASDTLPIVIPMSRLCELEMEPRQHNDRRDYGGFRLFVKWRRTKMDDTAENTFEPVFVIA